MTYADWWYALERICDKTRDVLEEWSRRGVEGEDLSDYMETISTLLSFSPNPRAFVPPILPEEVGKIF